MADHEHNWYPLANDWLGCACGTMKAPEEEPWIMANEVLAGLGSAASKRRGGRIRRSNA